MSLFHLTAAAPESAFESPTPAAFVAYQPVTAGFSANSRERSATRKERRASWALTWIGPEAVIVPSAGMNVPEMGR